MGQDSPTNIAVDRYEILSEIGRGGMGVVLKAHDRVLNIPVAIKVLGNDPTGIGAARLQREATAAGKLTHQNIARVFDFGQTSDSKPYMVMEFLDGQSLSDLIKQEGRLDCYKAVPIFAQIASALAYAHENGIIHRDLKPSNVMLIDWGALGSQAKLLDFGVAKVFSLDQSLTRTGAITGSPLYMSPEQANGDEATMASDIYSFGCLMFETLTGQVPFQGDSALETLSMHRNSAPPLLTDLISIQKLPNDLVLLVDECLHKSPKNRPADFKNILERLKTIEDKLENRELTQDLIQKISNQHFKIRIHQFWISNFGLITIMASLAVLGCFGLSIFQSEQKKVAESKLTPKAVHQEEIVKECLGIQPDNGEHFAYLQIENGLQVVSNDAGNDDYMSELKGRKIFNLCLEHGTYDGSGMKYINHDLVGLTIANVAWQKDNIRFLEPMKSLRLLCIKSPNLSDEDLKLISKIKSIRELRLHSDLITNKGVDLLRNLPDLDYLVIESPGITDDVVKSLLKMRKLRKLQLRRTAIGPEFLEKIASMNYLDDLGLDGTRTFCDKSFDSLYHFKNLRTLSLADMKLDENAFIKVSKMDGITNLDFSEAIFDPSNFHYLQNMPKLKYIDFWKSRNISDELIQNISQLKSLEDINFNDTNISESQFLKLTKIRSLNHVRAQSTKISPEIQKIFTDTFVRIWRKDCVVETSIKEGLD